MSKSCKIQNLSKQRVVILDGATGTELQKKGMPSGICPELWCIENSLINKEIHTSYIQAGAQIVYTCTFGANRFKLSQYDAQESTYQVNCDLALLARQAAGKKILVAGDIGPTGLFVEPFGPLSFEEAVSAYKEQVRGLIDGGCDLIVIETMIDIQEARAALLAVKETKDIFTIVSMTYEKDGHTLNGTDPVSALITLQSLGADAVGCNCSTGPEKMLEFISAMKPYATVPLVAKPNAGVPRLEKGKTVFDMDYSIFGFWGEKLIETGANMIGGCCGTTPLHIQKLAQSLAGKISQPPCRKSISAVSSSRKHLIFESNNPVYVIGERINQTGKKAMQQELLEGENSIIRQMATEQERQGAHLLDVNVGQAGIDEVMTIKSAIGLLTQATRLPLVVDSSKTETIEAALRLYPGRMLINSISGENEKIAKLLPLAAKYGAMFILLPLLDRKDGGIPDTAEKRQVVINNIYKRVREYGFTKDDFLVDCLVMAVGSDPGAAQETLKTLRWCTEIFRCKTIFGLSNVSFGMPARPWLNAAFLAMAQLNGLTAAIANPGNMEFMNIKHAGDVLTAKKKSVLKFIEHFSDKNETAQKNVSLEILSLPEKINSAIMEGDRENIVPFIKSALVTGMEAPALLDKFMIPAIMKVGDLYEKKIYFLPQLMASAETMKNALNYLEPLLKETAGNGKAKILMATVKGDIHDIGKNIVSLLLRNYGFHVIDIGKDVATVDILNAAKKENPDVIGLSALITTTMVKMKEVIETARAEGLKTHFLLGGAVVTEAYAHSIGAAFARDGVEAVRIIEKLLCRSEPVCSL
jgi:5-methyltetrahydrofolate--homocysteine methyltransferase